MKEKIGESEPAEEVEEDEETSEAETSIEELELSVRAYNCLKRAHIDTVQELVSILQERPEDLKKIKNLGQKTFEEIVEKVEKWSCLLYTSILDDDWTVVTKDGGLSAHFEHTVWVTKKGPVILTHSGDKEQ